MSGNQSPWSRIAEQVKTQDNACTAHPIFYVTQERRIYGVSADYTEKFVWITEGDQEFEEDEPRPPVCDYERVGIVDVTVYVQPFFTREAAEKYLEENRHNLTRPGIYVGSAYRNEEWQEVRRRLKDGE